MDLLALVGLCYIGVFLVRAVLAGRKGYEEGSEIRRGREKAESQRYWYGVYSSLSPADFVAMGTDPGEMKKLVGAANYRLLRIQMGLDQKTYNL